MTCFWIGVIFALGDTINVLDSSYENRKPSPKEFAKILQKHNMKTRDVLWNGMKLTEKELEENFEHVKNYDLEKMNYGYDCSSCDPFLLLISQLFNINIIHDYDGNTIDYISGGDKCINVHSNKGHFWRGK